VKHIEYCDYIFDQFYDLLGSDQKENKLGCFLAMNKILSVGRETRIVHYVNKFIPEMLKLLQTSNPELVEKAAECLANLAKAGGSVTAENVEKALDEAIKWLSKEKKVSKSGSDIKRYSGVLILREFCKKLPIITFNKLFDNDSYKCIFAAFRDPRVTVRDTAAECINICLSLISERESKSKRNLLKLIYDEIKLAFEDEDPNYQHSALTVLMAILQSKGSISDILKVS
jgi:serine/threonine-protein kinase mTOR